MLFADFRISRRTIALLEICINGAYLWSKNVVLLAVLQALRLVTLDKVEGFRSELRVTSVVGFVTRVGQASGYRHVSFRQFVLEGFRPQCEHTACEQARQFLKKHDSTLILCLRATLFLSFL